MSLAEVENMATMQLFTLGGSGGHAPQGNFDNFRCSEGVGVNVLYVEKDPYTTV